MASSSIPRAKAALLDLLRAIEFPVSTSSDDEPSVFYGAPQDLPREAIIVGDTASSDQTWFTFKRATATRAESYMIALHVVVMRPGDEQQEATERAFDLLSAIEDELRDRPDFIDASHWVKISGPDLVEGSTNEGRAAIIDVALEVEGNI